MTTDSTSLEERLIPTPHFSNYDGGPAFIFQDTLYQKHDVPLGNGGFGQVYFFQAYDGSKIAVKFELLRHNQYQSGADFMLEANWYKKIYGLGELSGDPANYASPHYILMPYFEGKTLFSFSFPTTKELLFCWIKTADALNQLHQQHKVVHCDFKSDNILFGKRIDPTHAHTNNDQAFIVDFGFATQIGMKRSTYLYDTQENHDIYTQHPPEIFTRRKKVPIADPAQDIYSLGMLLLDMYTAFIENDNHPKLSNPYASAMDDVIDHLTLVNAHKRWSIAKAIFIVVSGFFSQVPREVWRVALDEGAVKKVNHNQVMISTWHTASAFAIQYRCDELRAELKSAEERGKTDYRKSEKIKGLNLLQSEIQIQDPKLLMQLITTAKKIHPELAAGIFSKRTAMLMDELSTVAPVFH